MYDVFSEDFIRKFTKEELDNMTLEDINETADEVQEEINQTNNKIHELLPIADNFLTVRTVLAATLEIHFQQNVVAGFRGWNNLLRMENLEQHYNKLVKIIIEESKKNDSISEDTKKKLNELEEEIKKNKKSRSLFGDVSLLLFKSSITGMDLGD